MQQASIACTFDPRLVQSDVLFLDVASRSRPRAGPEKEQERLPTATERLTALAFLKSGYDCFARYARTFATSAAGHGWLVRMPTLSVGLV